jgi:hypothetical protein
MTTKFMVGDYIHWIGDNTHGGTLYGHVTAISLQSRGESRVYDNSMYGDYSYKWELVEQCATKDNADYYAAITA